MKIKTSFTAPLLCLCVFLLTVCMNLFSNFENLSQTAVLLILLFAQAFTFLAPSGVYVFLRGGGLKKKMRFRIFSGGTWLFTVLSALSLLFGMLVISLVLGRLGFLETGFASYSDYIGSGFQTPFQTFLVIIGFAALPAFCEELVFRGIILAEYDAYGPLLSAFATSILFGMLHLSPAGFFLYFFAGLLLSFVTYVTRSVFPAMLIHFAYNLFSIYCASYVRGIAENMYNFSLLLILLVIVFWILILLCLNEASRIYRVYGAENVPSDHVPEKRSASEKLTCAAEVILSPAYLGCVLVFLIVAIM